MPINVNPAYGPAISSLYDPTSTDLDIAAQAASVAVGSDGTTYGPQLVTAQDWIRMYLALGMGFIATTNTQTSAGAGNFPLSIFNPVSDNRTLVVYSFAGKALSAETVQVRVYTTDPNYGAVVTPNNSKLGAGGLTASANVTAGTVTQAISGTAYDFFEVPASTNIDVFQNGALQFLPPGYGLVFFHIAAAIQTYGTSVRWIEL